MRRTISFINTTARRASATCVSRINQNHRYANPFSLVFDKGAQLKERPTMQRCSLRLPNPYPVAYPFEIFEGNSASGVLSLSNDTFADVVVRPLGKPLFFAAKFAQATLSGFRVFTLKFLAQATMTETNVFDCLSRMNFAVRIRGDVDDSGVYTKRVSKLHWRRFFNIACCEQKVVSFGCSQIGFALSCLQQLALPFTAYERYSHAPIHRPDRDSGLLDLPAEDAFVVGNAASCLKSVLRFFVQLVSVGDFRNTTHGHLSRQAKLRTHLRVSEMVQFVLTEPLALPRRTADVVARGIRSFKGAFQCACLLWRGLKFDLRGQFHGLASLWDRSNYGIVFQVLKAVERLTPLAYLPGLKTGVSHEATS